MAPHPPAGRRKRMIETPWQGRAPGDFGFEHILYSKADGIGRITINRPQVLNALNWATLRELQTAFEDASWDDAVGVVVLTGAGERAFCTGADLDEQEQFLERPHDYWKWMGAFIEAHDKLRNIGKPTIARLNGITVGGGTEFNMACDLAVAADDIFIRQVGPARGSVPAGGATQWLPIIVGDRRAREILLLCEEIPIAKALDWGLVNQVVPRAELDSAVDAMAGKLLARLPTITRYTRTQLNFWRDLSWNLTVQHARDWLSVHSDSAEVAEGLSAFHGRRPVDVAGLRAAQAAAGSAPPWTCPACGAGMAPAFAFCGQCGTARAG
ncbi:MAG TPA: enoyl-CoA hydratase-related protein [Chloroflexia bacterium]|nr:enoyl-CoA hydratase-related protein [Chloroflexia bacterium]